MEAVTLAPQYELAYQEAKRAIDSQDRLVDQMQTAAGILFAAGAITTTFFGGSAFDRGDIGTAGWVAIVCFGLLGTTVLAVLWPGHRWYSTVGARRFIATYVEHDEGPLDLPEIHRDIALHMADAFAANDRRIRLLIFSFGAGSALLVLEVVAWVAGILDGA
jgi:hypothetical protein